MTWIQAIIIAIVEGLTEFLPISSTAHIKFTRAIMGISAGNAFMDMYDIVIQFAAILAVVFLYFKKFIDVKNISFYIKLAIAVMQSLIFGFLFKKHIDKMLGDVTVIACITLAGGVLLLFIEKLLKNSKIEEEEQITPISAEFAPYIVLINGKIEEEGQITPLNALKIGVFQLLAILLPGFSRSAATIIGGMANGLTKKAAAEFSFFLAVPTMAAATAKDIWDTMKSSPQVLHDSSNIATLGIGCAVAFIVSVLAMKSFLSYVQKHSFAAFGIYRIIAGCAMLALIYTHVIKIPPATTTRIQTPKQHALCTNYTAK